MPNQLQSALSPTAILIHTKHQSTPSLTGVLMPNKHQSAPSLTGVLMPSKLQSTLTPVRSGSNWSVDALQAPVHSESDWNIDAHQAPVHAKSNWSLDALQAPVRSESNWSVDAQPAPVCSESDWNIDTHQAPVHAKSDWSVDAQQVPVQVESNWSVDALQAPVRPESDWSVDAQQALVRVEPDWSFDAFQGPVRAVSDWSVNVLQTPGHTKSLFDPCSGQFGAIYEGRRVKDGLWVAVKFVKKTEDRQYYINFPEPLPLEVALLILVNEGPRVPQIIQLLDWKDVGEYCIMILERPIPCEDLFDFVQHHGGRIDEELARVVMRQATQAAYMSCQRGVLHRDIKKENLLINKDTLEVKLIDFGCGDLLQSAPYTTFMGTQMYCPPEFLSEGKYHGEPATVYSLGVLLFSLVCGTFPDSVDLIMINLNRWFIAGLLLECCQLICSCLQREPTERLDLGKILHHEWFKVLN
ncbi:serine/threonine-protein kinase pim-2-like [Sinocyclocheilus anshuiensis]|uniref:serine/threonine-protein kinase pim-2-like n=1 Tax=Sinocyclocheilus anshuiensis TaxID=1608454 RepID=UPI0007B97D08|nr:PREDICTED: serine/threonine-protein kinase pim-2-like [Sinocyclocheilus anshuiensis]